MQWGGGVETLVNDIYRRDTGAVPTFLNEKAKILRIWL